MLAEGDEGTGDGGEETTETDQDAEAREYATLVDNANLGEVFEAALSQRSTEGATHELQQHHKLAGNAVPLDMLHRSQDSEGAELRTAGFTPAPADTGAMQRPIIPAVFPRAAVSFLSIQQDRVPVGDAVYTVLATSAVPGTPAKGTDQDHTEGSIAAKVLQPARIQASMFYQREDRARLMGMDSALRMNLSDALADKLDQVVIADLLSGNTLGANNAGALDDYASYRKRFVYDRIDGTWAAEAMELRLVLGSATYGHMAATYRSNESDMNALGAIMRETGGARVSAHVPALASKKQQGLVRRGMRQDYAIGLWQGITIIPDEISLAKSGEIILTAILLFANELLRADGFAKVQAQTQA